MHRFGVERCDQNVIYRVNPNYEFDKLDQVKLTVTSDDVERRDTRPYMGPTLKLSFLMAPIESIALYLSIYHKF